MALQELFKLWSMATTADPYSRRHQNKTVSGQGVTQPGVKINLRNGEWGTGGVSSLRVSAEQTEQAAAANRMMRYKEYERLMSMPEIDSALTVMTDETCVVGSTPVVTPMLGEVPIKTLAETKAPDERFLVYCFDFRKGDYTLGWAYHPRKTKHAEVVTVALDDGGDFTCTPDHRVLLRTGEWKAAGDLKFGDDLMPFYRVPADPTFTKQKTKQFPRLFTLTDGWKTERQFITQWKTGKKTKREERLYEIIRHVADGCTVRQVEKLVGRGWHACDCRLQAAGFSYREVRRFSIERPDYRRVIGVSPAGTQDVYDLSVVDHENFATPNAVMHNCQIGENGHMFDIRVKNEDVKKILEKVFFHPGYIDIDNILPYMVKELFQYGDQFYECVLDPECPRDGILRIDRLPPDTMYRLQSPKGRVYCFQQSDEGPDIEFMKRVNPLTATAADMEAANAIMFAPEQIVHWRVGPDRKGFTPYGVSLIEAARGPANQLRLMEDAMLMYRLQRAPERRVFYVDVGNMPHFKAENHLGRLQDLFRKKKTFNSRGGPGAGGVDERFNMPDPGEDIWIPTRPNSQTRVETLPGAQNLGEVDDVLFFRNKVFLALNFPKNYLMNEDPSAASKTLSSMSAIFAHQIERFQKVVAKGLMEVALRHLGLVGIPQHYYDDLQICLTPPSHVRELSEQDIIQARFDRAAAIKNTGMMSDFDILVHILQFTEDRAKEFIARATVQKMQELRYAVMAQNPQLLGIVMPGQGDTEMGVEPGGPNPMLGGPDGDQPPPGGESPPPDPEGEGEPAGGPPPADTAGQDGGGSEPKGDAGPQGTPIPKARPADIKKFDLQIYDSSAELGEEEIDAVELDEY